MNDRRARRGEGLLQALAAPAVFSSRNIETQLGLLVAQAVRTATEARLAKIGTLAVDGSKLTTERPSARHEHQDAAGDPQRRSGGEA